MTVFTVEVPDGSGRKIRVEAETMEEAQQGAKNVAMRERGAAPTDLSAAGGRVAMERSGDPRFAPPPPQPPPQAAPPVDRPEDPMRIATSVPQGVNAGLYKGVMGIPDLLASIPRVLGLVSKDAPLPSQRVQRAGQEARDRAGITYTPNIVPETTGERIGFQVGDAVGQVASTAVPGSIVAKTAAPAVAGMKVAAPTYGQTVAQTLATQPGLQVAGTTAGNLTTEFTGNPWLGLGASFAVPTLAHGAQRIPFSAPAKTGAEVERRALLADASKEGILPSFGSIQDSWFSKMLESVVGKLPFVGGTQTKINEGNKAAFNRAALDKISAVKGQGLDAATTGTIDSVKAKIGQQFDNLQNNTTVRIDPQFGADISKAKLDFSKQLRDQMPASVLNKLDELESAARAHNQPGVTAVTLDGETYKNIRSKLSAQLSTAQGTDKTVIGQMIDALDGAVERSLPKDMVKDWQDARLGWRRITTIEDSVKGRHSGETAVGNIPPGSLEARAGSDAELRRLGTIGVKLVGDKMPESGTSWKTLIQGGMGLGAGAGVATQFPLTALAAGAGGIGLNQLLNHPYARRLLIDRLQPSRVSEGVMSPELMAIIAAQRAENRGGR
jgi:hypothetical protein